MILKAIGISFGIFSIYVWYHAIVTPDSCKELLQKTESHYRGMGASKEFVEGILAEKKTQIESAVVAKDEFCKFALGK